MKLLRPLLLLLLPLCAWAGGVPYGIFGGAPTFATLPGNIPLIFNVAPTSTSTALAVAWPGVSGSYLVVFSDWESRSVTLTNAATTATWSGALVGTPVVTATIDGYTSTPSNIYGYTSDLGTVWSTGTGWYAAAGYSGAPVYISSGCTAVSLTKGTATTFQFQTTATTCTPVIQLPPAPNGWYCFAQDSSTGTAFTVSAQNTYSCTVTATTVSGNTVQVQAIPY